MKLSFIPLFGVALAAVFLRPEQAPAPVPRAASPETAQLAVAQTDHWAAGETELERAGDGHFYAEVKVNDAQARMLVDTGASTVALTGQDAAAMGLSWTSDQVQPVASGASGPVYGVRVTLERVQVGDREVRAVDAVIIPEGLGISLLGQSFLGKIGRVEIAGDKMILGDAT